MQIAEYPPPNVLPGRGRAALASAGVTAATGLLVLVVRLLDPEHPFRVYMQGAAVQHRARTATVLGPAVSGDTIRAAVYVALGVVALGFLLAVAVAALA